ncbi:MAG: chromosome segregation protein SMC [Xanthomonadales bacterium]|jgi:chromosome segregation protein|nr:chromosome segregation protein SMC [Xanthomonadales bacterium]
MRLSTIKLAGFKSFVDHTTLHLPTNMTGVVGPNGCGKSNIIDAVRWVMGESSASRLRGDNLTDVIFSGSSGRKPVGTATVELIFDNSDGTILGEYAQYAEISVKRMVSRDGASAYYLNGTRCRRRDITDLFLGTGLGPRSYSIIEQGMISQIIEARPEDLRVYLEEAAGISKYKERRRETESRIKQTRENLDRLNDVREEVDKQLEHLRRQAKQAEQYQQLRAEQRERDAQVKAMDYRVVEHELLTLRHHLNEEDIALEAMIAEQRHVEAQLELCREQQTDASAQLTRVQAESYRIGGDIARVEQQIRHQLELSQRLQQSRTETQQSLDEVNAHLQDDQTRLAGLGDELAHLQPEVESLRELLDQATNDQHAADGAVTEWQRAWETHRVAQAEATRSADVDRTRIDYLDRQSLESARRRETLQQERLSLDIEAVNEQLAERLAELDAQRESVEQLTQTLETRKHAITALQDRQRQAQAEQAEVRKEMQNLRGRLGSLEGLQHAALGQTKGAAQSWLQTLGLEQLPRVGQQIQVQPGWELAVETVLGSIIEAVLVDEPTAFASALPSLQSGRVHLMSAATDILLTPTGSLAAMIEGPASVRRLLTQVRAASSLEAALNLLPQLAEGESVITQAGEWIAADSVRLVCAGEAQHGALARERDIQQLRAEIDALGLRDQALTESLSKAREQQQDAELAREDAQRSLYLAHRSVAELAGQVQSLRGRVESAQTRVNRIEAELGQLAEQMQHAQEQAAEARAALDSVLQAMGEHETRRLHLEAEREHLQTVREQAHVRARDVRERSHALALQLESRRSQHQGLQQSVHRMQAQQMQLAHRLSELDAQLAVGDAPHAALQAERQTFLEARSDVDRQLSAARSAVEGIDAELRANEQKRQMLDQRALLLRDQINRRRLDEQAMALKAQGLSEALLEAGLDMTEVMAALPENADAEQWRRTLADLEARIRRLEPVNLAAIQEFGEQSQRKEYLDSQHKDLTEALETLEGAIRKIDRETRGRFKDTFDRVNTGMQELYPRLVGGGHAYLELTSEDLLETGVAIMARPPGKRVSNISLLSGGEKALTAVAMIFAIFRLNPAPFCLLDEVDAPLDEANVGRFSAMVTEMSERVQFLFVTHNKATMESARQLAGVTMREPGVSRLVSVDIDEAARLMGAA